LDIVVGGPGNNVSIGAVWVFEKTDGIYSQQGGSITPPDVIGPAQFGYSVSLSGTAESFAAGGPTDDAGAIGAAWFYLKTLNSQWTYVQKLIDSNVIVQGACVCLSKDAHTLAVGGPFDAGRVGLWQRSLDNVWTTLPTTLLDDDAFEFGTSCSFSSDATALAVGAPGTNGVGAVYVYI
jgi:hypothetical protein